MLDFDGDGETTTLDVVLLVLFSGTAVFLIQYLVEALKCAQ